MAAYCSYIGAVCAHGDKPLECAAQSAVKCHEKREKLTQKSEQKEKPTDENADRS